MWWNYNNLESKLPRSVKRQPCVVRDICGFFSNSRSAFYLKICTLELSWLELGPSTGNRARWSFWMKEILIWWWALCSQPGPWTAPTPSRDQTPFFTPHFVYLVYRRFSSFWTFYWKKIQYSRSKFRLRTDKGKRIDFRLYFSEHKEVWRWYCPKTMYLPPPPVRFQKWHLYFHRWC
jgi:hypothetical protein